MYPKPLPFSISICIQPARRLRPKRPAAAPVPPLLSAGVTLMMLDMALIPRLLAEEPEKM